MVCGVCEEEAVPFFILTCTFAALFYTVLPACRKKKIGSHTKPCWRLLIYYHVNVHFGGKGALVVE